MAMKLTFSGSDVATTFDDIKKPFRKAVLAAFEDASKLLLARGRANIRAAGFSSDFQNAWTTKVYPNINLPLSPAVFGHHKFFFSNVFEKGAVIRGKPLLWLPLPRTPKFIGGKRTTPQLWVNIVGPLASSKQHSGGKPLLFGKLPGSNERVPLFVGVHSAKIGKRLDIQRVADGVADELSALFDKHMKE